MINECKHVGLPEPSFEEHGGGLEVAFLKDIYTEDYFKKSGNTGKGTIYSLRGHKGDKGDIKGLQRENKEQASNLDKKLLLLKKELSKVNPENEIKGHFDSTV